MTRFARNIVPGIISEIDAGDRLCEKTPVTGEERMSMANGKNTRGKTRGHVVVCVLAGLVAWALSGVISGTRAEPPQAEVGVIDNNGHPVYCGRREDDESHASDCSKPLGPCTKATFFDDLNARLKAHGITCKVDKKRGCEPVGNQAGDGDMCRCSSGNGVSVAFEADTRGRLVRVWLSTSPFRSSKELNKRRFITVLKTILELIMPREPEKEINSFLERLTDSPEGVWFVAGIGEVRMQIRPYHHMMLMNKDSPEWEPAKEEDVEEEEEMDDDDTRKCHRWDIDC
ncbi:MAG: hypothetical protein LBR29_09085 [Methylobacteriaceae bacterium]|jgi:hypothetical protein|nr:hypothetical protein [Methylobacteriaceae bacterium]